MTTERRSRDGWIAAGAATALHAALLVALPVEGGGLAAGAGGGAVALGLIDMTAGPAPSAAATTAAPDAAESKDAAAPAHPDVAEAMASTPEAALPEAAPRQAAPPPAAAAPPPAAMAAAHAPAPDVIAVRALDAKPPTPPKEAKPAPVEADSAKPPPEALLAKAPPPEDAEARPPEPKTAKAEPPEPEKPEPETTVAAPPEPARRAPERLPPRRPETLMAAAPAPPKPSPAKPAPAQAAPAGSAAPESSSSAREAATGASAGGDGAEQASAEAGGAGGKEIASLPGDDRVEADARRRYAALVRGLIEREKRYPRRARMRGRQGVATVRFVVDRSGRISGEAVAESAGETSLDRESLDMLKRASPLPAMPAEITDEQLTFVFPVRFSLR